MFPYLSTKAAQPGKSPGFYSMVVYAKAGQETKWESRVLRGSNKGNHTDSLTLATMTNSCTRDTLAFLSDTSCYKKEDPIYRLWEDIAEIWPPAHLPEIAL